MAVDIDPSSSPEALTRFDEYADATSLTYAFDHRGEFVRTFQIQQLDTTVILDHTGVEVYRDQIPSTYEMLRKAIEGALGL